MAGLLRVVPDVTWLSIDGEAIAIAQDGVACSPASAAAFVERANGGWEIRNARSRVRILGARLGGSSRHALVPGDVVRIGTTLLIWQASPPRALARASQGAGGRRRKDVARGAPAGISCEVLESALLNVPAEARVTTALARLEAGEPPHSATDSRSSGMTQGELRVLIARGLSAREIATRAGWSLAHAKEKIRARNGALRR